jgi:hypothetical protein
MPLAVGELLRAEDRFLGFFRVLVDIHDLLSPSIPNFQLPNFQGENVPASSPWELGIGSWELT